MGYRVRVIAFGFLQCRHECGGSGTVPGHPLHHLREVRVRVRVRVMVRGEG